MFPTLKIVVIGDGMADKTKMLIAFTTNKYPDVYIPTVFDNYTINTMIDGKPIAYSLWDTAGQEDYDILRPLSYPGTDMLLLCFSIGSRMSFRNISEKFHPEVKKHIPTVPFYIVGTKIEYRDGFKDDEQDANGDFVSTAEGAALAEKLGAQGYLECSARTQQGLKTVFDTVIRHANTLKTAPSLKKKGFLSYLFGGKEKREPVAKGKDQVINSANKTTSSTGVPSDSPSATLISAALKTILSKSPTFDGVTDIAQNGVPLEINLDISRSAITADLSLAEDNKREDDDLPAAVAKALAQGSKEWRRIKILFVGDGRAGKTALANSIMGKAFVDTASTVGINQLTCDVKHVRTTAATTTAAVGGIDGVVSEGVWSEYVKPEKELEVALAEIMAASRIKMDRDNPTNKSHFGVIQCMQDSDRTEDIDEKSSAEIFLLPPAVAIVGNTGTQESSTPNQNQSTVFDDGQQKGHGNNYGTLSTAHIPLENVNTSDKNVLRKIDDVNATASQGTAAETTDIQIDEGLVMKLLAEMTEAESGLIISLFDYGGQSVFDAMHHLFLTCNGIYIVIFDMQWLVDFSDAVRSRGLRLLNAWLSSIAVHTYDSSTKKTAPIVLVGTHMDVVNSIKQHEIIDAMLKARFCDNVTWPSVLHNDDISDTSEHNLSTLCFFPVDNTLGQRGPNMKRLLSVLHTEMEAAVFTHKEVPLTWLHLMDKLQSIGENFVTMATLLTIAEQCRISEEEVSYFLSFLHDMGYLMWHDEDGLRDAVILDAVSYLVTPATTVICNLKPSTVDNTHHKIKEHDECERKFHKEFLMLREEGVLSTKLLPILWRKYPDRISTLLRLLVKFGLFVPLRISSQPSQSEKVILLDETTTHYLVPSLLPCAPAEHLKSLVHWTDKPVCTTYFVFTLSEDIIHSSVLSRQDLHTQGFLPHGLFERILGKALSWAHETSKACRISLDRYRLHRDLAVLCFGKQRFRLLLCDNINAVRVDIEGSNPLVVQQRLLDQINKIIAECMRALFCFPALLHTIEVAGAECVGSALPVDLSDKEVLLPIKHLRSAVENRISLYWRKGSTLLSDTEIKAKFAPWLQLHSPRTRYDVFISYRWGSHDSIFAQALFDMFTNFSLGESSLAVEVFLDRRRLQEGRQITHEIAAALAHSSVVVPVISAEVLSKMCHLDIHTVDSVLLEWILMIECYKAGKVLKILPIFFGGRGDEPEQCGDLIAKSGVIDNHSIQRQSIIKGNGTFFSTLSANALPNQVVAATLRNAEVHLKNLSVTPSGQFHSSTVQSVVDELMQFGSVHSPLVLDQANFVEIAAEKTVALLEEVEVANRANANLRGDKDASLSKDLITDTTTIAPVLLTFAAPSLSSSSSGDNAAPTVASFDILMETSTVESRFTAATALSVLETSLEVAVQLPLFSPAVELLRQFVQLGQNHLSNEDEFNELYSRMKSIYGQFTVIHEHLENTRNSNNSKSSCERSVLKFSLSAFMDTLETVMKAAVKYIKKTLQRGVVMRFINASKMQSKFADIDAKLTKCYYDLCHAIQVQTWIEIETRRLV